MIFSKRSLFSYCGALACSFSLYAADASEVSVAKTSVKDSFFPGAYSSLEMSMKQKRDVKEGKDLKGTMNGSYTLGSSFFKEKLDLSVTLGTKVEEEGPIVVKDVGTSFLASYKVYKNDYYNLSTTASVALPETGKTKTSTSLGGSHELSYKYEAAAGEFSASLGHVLTVSLGDEPSLTKLTENGKDVKTASLTDKVRKELNLVDKEGDLYAEQQTPSVSQSLSLGIKWKPSYVKGLSFSLAKNFEQSKSPTIELDRKGKLSLNHKTRESFDWPIYKDSNSSENKVGAKYEFNKENTWVCLDFAFSDLTDSGERDYSIKGSVGMKLL